MTKLSLIQSLRWLSIGLSIREPLRLAQVLILARILTPSDFGEIAIITSIVAFLALIVEFGVHPSIIHDSDNNNRKLSTLFWCNLSIAMFLYAIAALIISLWSKQDTILFYFLIAGAALPISALGIVTKALTEKIFLFKEHTFIETSALLTSFLVTIVLAELTQSPLAIFIGNIVYALVILIIYFSIWKTHFIPSLIFSLDDLKNHISFGVLRLFDVILNDFSRRIDIFILATIVSQEMLGYYSITRDLTLRISNKIFGPILRRLGLPTLASARARKEKLGDIYIQIVHLLTSCTVPIFTILILFPKEIISVLLGHQWLESAALLQILAAWGLAKSFISPAGNLLLATGEIKRSIKWSLIYISVLAATIYITGSMFGLIAAAISILCLQAILVPASWKALVIPLVPITIPDLLKATLPQLLCSALAIVLYYLLPTKWVTPNYETPIFAQITQLAFDTGIYLLLYLTLSFFLNRNFIKSICLVVRKK